MQTQRYGGKEEAKPEEKIGDNAALAARADATRRALADAERRAKEKAIQEERRATSQRYGFCSC